MAARCLFGGLFERSGSEFAVSSTSTELLERQDKAVHGLSENDIIWVEKAGEGGVGTLWKVGAWFFVKVETTKTFKISKLPVAEFKAAKWSTEIKGTTGIQKIVECTTTPYKREAISVGTSTDGKGRVLDNIKRNIPCAEGANIAFEAAFKFAKPSEEGSVVQPEVVEIAETEQKIGGAKEFGLSETELAIYKLT